MFTFANVFKFTFCIIKIERIMKKILMTLVAVAMATTMNAVADPAALQP